MTARDGMRRGAGGIDPTIKVAGDEPVSHASIQPGPTGQVLSASGPLLIDMPAARQGRQALGADVEGPGVFA